MSLISVNEGENSMSMTAVTADIQMPVDHFHPGVAHIGRRRSAELEHQLVIIDPRALTRECLANSIRAFDDCFGVQCFGSFAEWERARDRAPATSAILLSLGGRKISDPDVSKELKKFSAESNVPIILLAETEALPHIIGALSLGIRGFIPSSVGIEVCVEAIRLALAGGIFIPASSVLGMKDKIEASYDSASLMSGLFTVRQAEVAEALRRGKANKIIAYEMKLKESTVKVHIRHIMKKLKATNRTEVAFRINDLFPSDN